MQTITCWHTHTQASENMPCHTGQGYGIISERKDQSALMQGLKILNSCHMHESPSLYKSSDGPSNISLDKSFKGFENLLQILKRIIWFCRYWRSNCTGYENTSVHKMWRKTVLTRHFSAQIPDLSCFRCCTQFSRWKPLCLSSDVDSSTDHKSMLNHQCHIFTPSFQSHFAFTALCYLLSAESVSKQEVWGTGAGAHRLQTTVFITTFPQ